LTVTRDLMSEEGEQMARGYYTYLHSAN